MPRIKKKAKRRNDYTIQEKRVLLTGVPLHADSTRFGHPFHGPGLRLDEIAQAWKVLGEELEAEWQTELFEYHRLRHDRPWAVRVLEGLR